ncbi:ThuA domain-containing protein [Streptomyces sp. V4-01]|uniref:ThuA domain-containing protein n=1 Tax=Actinacidiphila polyblastidii TaxID=3110430 RepID=A0ABU7P965_9ACTN|nr:ThuA domain-containing protein [Streptomyces sp. V4-01]
MTGHGRAGRPGEPKEPAAPAGPAESAAHDGHAEDGDPVCWLDHVCDACGAFRENPRSPVCARCGAAFAGARAAPAATALTAPRPGSGTAAVEAPQTVLVFTATAGYRHDSIPAGVAALRELAASRGLSVLHSEDPRDLRPGRLDGCAAVVFLSPTGDVLDDGARASLRGYVTGGGGLLGVHAAACAEYGWPYYGELLGARFDGHPEIQRAAVTAVDRAHPATAHLPEEWVWTDEWYDFREGPAGRDVRVLATVDEDTYQGGGMGAPHPLVWCREPGEGRVLYTALGHLASAYSDPCFRRHLLGALSWCARAEG